MTMNNITHIPGRENSRRSEIEAQARAWVIRLDGDPDKDEVMEFRAWLRKSPLHREIFRQASETWGDMDQLAEVYFADSDNRKGIRGLPRLSSNRYIFTSGIAAACLILVAFVTAFIVNQNDAIKPVGPASVSTAYKTTIGEIRTVVLPDGTNVKMNTDTSMNVSYGRETRLVNLQSGEAYFEVAHNTVKPFVVRTGNYLVRATGTAFSVKLLDNNLDILVTNGHVDVKALKHHQSADSILDLQSVDHSDLLATLGKDQKFVLHGDQAKQELIQSVEPGGVEKSLSWRDGMLMFDNDPLEKVITEINRYTTMKVVISDSRIRDIRFGGYFHISDISSILATMEENFGIHADKVSDKVVYLSLRDKS